MLTTIRKAEYAELMGLFFFQGGALGIWIVPLSRILDRAGLGEIRAWAFATSAIAAFVSPLVFGAMADRHASPLKVLQGLAIATGLAMALASTAIGLHWNRWVILLLIQLHALCSAPSLSILSAIVFARLSDAKREFGPIRAMATLGWMAGCWLVSALDADASVVAGYAGALIWLLLAGLTLLLPHGPSPKTTAHLTIWQRLGLDALGLLKQHDHRVVFITTALFCIPLAGFYPYTPMHLHALGLERTSAWMTLGQITEVLAMFSLGPLLSRWRFKWVFACGLGFGVLRFAFSAMNSQGWLLSGVLLHGASFTLVIIATQIYLDQRVDGAWRVRAQALLSLTTSGAGNLLGYLGTGWWFAASTPRTGGTHWPVFWSGLAGAVLLVLVYFLFAYQGNPVKAFQTPMAAHRPQSKGPGSS